jgi:hypothetical protein
MQLMSDDYLLVYYWTDEDGRQLSPRFDYEADAMQWVERVREEFDKLLVDSK